MVERAPPAILPARRLKGRACPRPKAALSRRSSALSIGRPGRRRAAGRPTSCWNLLSGLLPGVPARRPEARDQRRRRLPIVPLHGEGERRVRIVGGFGSLTSTLACMAVRPLYRCDCRGDLHPATRKAAAGATLARPAKPGSAVTIARDDVVQVRPAGAGPPPGSRHDVPQPAPALLELPGGPKTW